MNIFGYVRTLNQTYSYYYIPEIGYNHDSLNTPDDKPLLAGQNFSGDTFEFKNSELKSVKEI